MNNELLPIGSIVLLNDGKKKLMIYGRKQRMKSSGQVFDYLGCLYPEGYINPAYSFVFNHTQISKIIYKGFADEEELSFVNEVLSKVEEQPHSNLQPEKAATINDWK